MALAPTPGYRVGIGYDVHRLVKNRKLILGGVKIDHPTGLLGHSDADVLTHAVMSALLGAMAAGSLGDHFPIPILNIKTSNRSISWNGFVY